MISPKSFRSASECEASTLARHAGVGLISYSSIGAIVCLLDCILVVVTSIASGTVYHRFVNGSEADLSRFLMTALMTGALVVPVMRDRNLYDPIALMDWKLQARTIIVIWFIALLVFCGATFAFKIGKEFSRGAVLSFGAAGLLALLCHHALWRNAIRLALRKGGLRPRQSILLRMAEAPLESRAVQDLQTCGFRIEHEFYCGGSESPEETAGKVIAAVRGSAIEEIFLVADLRRWDEVNHLLQRLCVLPIQVTIVPDEGTAFLFQRPARQYGPTVGVEFQRPPLSKLECFWKRLFDLVFAGLGLVLLLPMFTIVALAIKLDSPGPVVFVQSRHGFNGRRFGIFKFRTMSVLEDDASIKQAQRLDKRVTRIGAWLRKSSIDELPQLFNVLIGDMSLVGPRPHATAHDSYYADLISEYAMRQHVKPGITGWAQIHGYRGETRTVEMMKARVDLDLWYVGNWSLLLDLLIVLRTIMEVVRSRNAY
jgi:Undecaprenyl-phosphate glucose phosphotransferase